MLVLLFLLVSGVPFLPCPLLCFFPARFVRASSLRLLPPSPAADFEPLVRGLTHIDSLER